MVHNEINNHVNVGDEKPDRYTGIFMNLKVPGLQFLARFFGDEARAAHFARVFVPPLSWEQLLDKIRVGSTRRVLVVDGQGRVGKSWSVAAAIAMVVDRGLNLDDVWTSGEDSCQLTPSSLEPLDRVLAELEKALRCRQSPPRLILLDDVLGTTRLRPVLDPNIAARWLSFDSEDNQMLSSLHPDGGLAIITNRSSILTAFHTETGVNVRDRQNPKVTRIAFGIFEREGKVLGDYDEARLHEMALRYGVSTTDVWYPSPHLLALRPFVLSGQWSEDKYRVGAYRDLFLADIEQLYRASALGSSSKPTPALERARKAFALTIAPGLLFMGERTFRMLGLEGATLDDLVVELHLRPVDEATRWVGSSVLPNSFFAAALKAFFQRPGRIPELCVTIDLWLPNLTAGERAIAVRGLIEQGLLQQEAENEPDDESTVALASAVDLCSVGESMEFLRWELSGMMNTSQAAPNWSVSQSCKSGFVAAVAWTLWRFSRLRFQLTTVIDGFCDTWLQIMTQGKGESITPAYSSLLQWVLWCVAAEQESGKDASQAQKGLERLKRLAEHSQNLKIILFDEALWAAFTDEASDFAPDLNRQLNDRGLSLLRELGWPPVTSNEHERANIYFSLCWHNGWLADTSQKEVADTWLNKEVEGLVTQNPHWICDNLAYHWQHSVVQTAVWMREWCLGDPFEQDRRRILQMESGLHGPIADQANYYFGRLMQAVFRRGSSEMVRNALLLSGIRMGSLKDARPWMGEVCGALSARLGGPDVSSPHRDDSVAVMEAIFELCRQDRIFHQESSEKPAPVIEDAAKEWIPKCREVAADAWENYRKGLEQATCLDVLPECYGDVSPKLAELLR